MKWKTGGSLSSEVCALGALGKQRGINMSELDPTDYDAAAAAFNCTSPLVREIEYENDEDWCLETPEQRWVRMRNWVAARVRA